MIEYIVIFEGLALAITVYFVVKSFDDICKRLEALEQDTDEIENPNNSLNWRSNRHSGS